jgi:hypothetical protein
MKKHPVNIDSDQAKVVSCKRPGDLVRPLKKRPGTSLRFHYVIVGR